MERPAFEEADFESYEGTTFVEEAALPDSLDARNSDSDEFVLPQGTPPTYALVCPLLSSKVIIDSAEPLVIGRSPKVDLTLPARKVSRRHAEIRFDGQGYSIHDLNSTNGTFVNGSRVHRRRRLRPGMKIEIGAFTFDVLELASRDEDIDIGDEEDDANDTILDLNADLSGMLEEIGVAEVIQFIENTGRTGVLTFYQSDGMGQVWIENGTVVHAEYGLEIGQTAALQLFATRRGRFDFKRGSVQCPRTVNKPTTALLMEAARLVDEASLENTDIQ